MKITFCIFNREGKQYMSVEENNTDKNHEIFLGPADQAQFPEKLIGILEISKKITDKENLIQLIGKSLISINFSG